MDIYGLNLQRIYIFHWHWCIPIFDLCTQIKCTLNQYKCPYWLRVVPGTEHKTNLRTTNLKINILVHTCYSPPLAIQQ